MDARGCLVTPGLINTHHHLYQWATRGQAVDSTLFQWLTELYPVWAGIDEDTVGAAATAALAWLARTGCTTTHGPPLRLPARAAATCSAPPSRRPAPSGLRFHPTRGSMDLGASAGGLPPDDVVEDTDDILAATSAAIDRFHDPSPESMLRIAVAPCSPFSVTGDLLAGSGAAGPRSAACGCTPTWPRRSTRTSTAAEHFGCTPVQYLDSLDWLGADVWLAHAVHLRRRGDRPAGRHRHRRGALPVVQRPAGRRDLPHARICSRRRAGRARGGRRGLQ